MAIRTVLSKGQDKEEARKVLERKYSGAEVRFEEKRDFLGHRWTEAIVDA